MRTEFGPALSQLVLSKYVNEIKVIPQTFEISMKETA